MLHRCWSNALTSNQVELKSRCWTKTDMKMLCCHGKCLEIISSGSNWFWFEAWRLTLFWLKYMNAVCGFIEVWKIVISKFFSHAHVSSCRRVPYSMCILWRLVLQHEIEYSGSNFLNNEQKALAFQGFRCLIRFLKFSIWTILKILDWSILISENQVSEIGMQQSLPMLGQHILRLLERFRKNLRGCLHMYIMFMCNSQNDRKACKSCALSWSFHLKLLSALVMFVINSNAHSFTSNMVMKFLPARLVHSLSSYIARPWRMPSFLVPVMCSKAPTVLVHLRPDSLTTGLQKVARAQSGVRIWFSLA